MYGRGASAFSILLNTLLTIHKSGQHKAKMFEGSMLAFLLMCDDLWSMCINTVLTKLYNSKDSPHNDVMHIIQKAYSCFVTQPSKAAQSQLKNYKGKISKNDYEILGTRYSDYDEFRKMVVPQCQINKKLHYVNNAIFQDKKNIINVYKRKEKDNEESSMMKFDQTLKSLLKVTEIELKTVYAQFQTIYDAHIKNREAYEQRVFAKLQIDPSVKNKKKSKKKSYAKKNQNVTTPHTNIPPLPNTPPLNSINEIQEEEKGDASNNQEVYEQQNHVQLYYSQMHDQTCHQQILNLFTQQRLNDIHNQFIAALSQSKFQSQQTSSRFIRDHEQLSKRLLKQYNKKIIESACTPLTYQEQASLVLMIISEFLTKKDPVQQANLVKFQEISQDAAENYITLMKHQLKLDQIEVNKASQGNVAGINNFLDYKEKQKVKQKAKRKQQDEAKRQSQQVNLMNQNPKDLGVPDNTFQVQKDKTVTFQFLDRRSNIEMSDGSVLFRSSALENYPDDHAYLRFEYVKVAQKTMRESQLYILSSMKTFALDCYDYITQQLEPQAQIKFSGSPFFEETSYRLMYTPHYFQEQQFSYKMHAFQMRSKAMIFNLNSTFKTSLIMDPSNYCYLSEIMGLLAIINDAPMFPNSTAFAMMLCGLLQMHPHYFLNDYFLNPLRFPLIDVLNWCAFDNKSRSYKVSRIQQLDIFDRDLTRVESLCMFLKSNKAYFEMLFKNKGTIFVELLFKNCDNKIPQSHFVVIRCDKFGQLQYMSNRYKKLTKLPVEIKDFDGKNTWINNLILELTNDSGIRAGSKIVFCINIYQCIRDLKPELSILGGQADTRILAREFFQRFFSWYSCKELPFAIADLKRSIDYLKTQTCCLTYENASDIDYSDEDNEATEFINQSPEDILSISNIQQKLTTFSNIMKDPSHCASFHCNKLAGIIDPRSQLYDPYQVIDLSLQLADTISLFTKQSRQLQNGLQQKLFNFGKDFYAMLKAQLDSSMIQQNANLYYWHSERLGEILTDRRQFNIEQLNVQLPSDLRAAIETTKFMASTQKAKQPLPPIQTKICILTRYQDDFCDVVQNQILLPIELPTTKNISKEESTFHINPMICKLSKLFPQLVYKQNTIQQTLESQTREVGARESILGKRLNNPSDQYSQNRSSQSQLSQIKHESSALQQYQRYYGSQNNQFGLCNQSQQNSFVMQQNYSQLQTPYQQFPQTPHNRNSNIQIQLNTNQDQINNNATNCSSKNMNSLDNSQGGNQENNMSHSIGSSSSSQITSVKSDQKQGSLQGQTSRKRLKRNSIRRSSSNEDSKHQDQVNQQLNIDEADSNNRKTQTESSHSNKSQKIEQDEEYILRHSQDEQNSQPNNANVLGLTDTDAHQSAFFAYPENPSTPNKFQQLVGDLMQPTQQADQETESLVQLRDSIPVPNLNRQSQNSQQQLPKTPYLTNPCFSKVNSPNPYDSNFIGSNNQGAQFLIQSHDQGYENCSNNLIQQPLNLPSHSQQMFNNQISQQQLNNLRLNNIYGDGSMRSSAHLNYQQNVFLQPKTLDDQQRIQIKNQVQSPQHRQGTTSMFSPISNFSQKKSTPQQLPQKNLLLKSEQSVGNQENQILSNSGFGDKVIIQQSPQHENTNGNDEDDQNQMEISPSRQPTSSPRFAINQSLTQELYENSFAQQNQQAQNQGQLQQQEQQNLIEVQQQFEIDQQLENDQTRAEEQKRIAEEQRIAEQKQMVELKELAKKELAEKQRIAEEKRIQQEKELEEQQIAEERKIADEERIAHEKELEEQKVAEEKRIAVEKELAEKQIVEERKIAEEKQIAEEMRIAEKKRVADEERIAEEMRIAEEEKLAKERLLAEEQQRLASDQLVQQQKLQEQQQQLQQQEQQQIIQQSQQIEMPQTKLTVSNPQLQNDFQIANQDSQLKQHLPQSQQDQIKQDSNQLKDQVGDSDSLKEEQSKGDESKVKDQIQKSQPGTQQVSQQQQQLEMLNEISQTNLQEENNHDQDGQMQVEQQPPQVLQSQQNQPLDSINGQAADQIQPNPPKDSEQEQHSDVKEAEVVPPND